MQPGRRDRWWATVLVVLGIAVFVSDAHGQQDSVQTIVEVDITGNRSFLIRDLMGVIESRESSWFSWLPWVDPAPLISSRVRTDLLRLTQFYKNEGFLEVSVDTLIERQKAGYRVAFLVVEGEPVLTDSVNISGLGQAAGFTIDRSKLKTVVETRLTRSGLEDDRLLIRTALRDSGYTFAQVDVTTGVDPVHRRALVEFAVATGSRYRFGDVVVRGSKNVGRPTIRRGVTFRPGARFEQEQVRQARRQLYRSGAFRSVVIDFPDSLAQDSTVTTMVTVSERSLRSVKLGAGYDTQNRINGSVSWTHRSAFGGAQQFRVGAQASAILTEFRASLTQPYVFGSRNWMNFGVFVTSEEKAEFRQNEVGGNVAFERNITSRTTLLFETIGGVVDFDADSVFVELVTQFIDDRRDDFLNPSEGIYVRLEAREKGALFQTGQELLQLTAEGRWYSKLPLNSVIATRIHGGVVVNLSENGDVPNFERFFSGGLSSVRGWPFNQLGPKDASGLVVGGKSKFEGSIELRTQLGKYLGTAVFLDMGNVDPQFNAFDFSAFKWAIGGGVRFLSPVGPVRLDAGRRLNEDNTSLWQYHFSIGQAF
jgi:outer membrane protein insertion porin family